MNICDLQRAGATPAAAQPIAYARPASLAEACERLSEAGAVAYAGGSDLLVALREGAPLAAGVRTLVDIKQLVEARGCESRGGLLRVGALSTAATLAGDPLLRARAPALAQAALATAAPAIRRRATLGGNICTPHPVGDVATALPALNAQVETATLAGGRRFALQALFSGETRLAAGIIALLTDLFEDGALDGVVLTVPDFIDDLEFLGEKVMPVLQARDFTRELSRSAAPI